jgi:hypothetical protein
MLAANYHRPKGGSEPWWTRRVYAKGQDFVAGVAGIGTIQLLREPTLVIFSSVFDGARTLTMMKYVIGLMIFSFIPGGMAMAKGECKEDRQKFCKDVIQAGGDVGVCMKQHEAEFSQACREKREANAKQHEQ